MTRILPLISTRLRPIFSILLATWMLQVGPSNALSYDDIQSRGVIGIAVYSNFPPYSFMDVNGNPAGMDVELANALAKGLGVELNLHWMTPDETVEDDMRNYLWKGMNLSSDDGQRVKADVMLRVPYDRAFAMQRDDLGLPAHELVHMFAPYHSERWLLAYDGDKLDTPQTAARFMYHPVGVEVDTVPQFYLTTAYGGRFRDNSRTFPSVTEAFSALTRGDVAMVMGMSSQLQWLHQQAYYPASQKVKNTSQNDEFSSDTSKKNASPDAAPTQKLTELAFPLLGRAEWELGIAVHTNYRQLAYALEDIVVAHIENGDFLRWGEKYGVRYQLPNRYLPVPL
ncbi:transporter substrate-binding domain-containing protein [Enterovibrio calviensis]|uniref:substrate-binding periplasmic protein n=1 Tax=Enterovibrio calviensis TaxID=91359 RepID=UPI0037354813